MQRVQSSSPCVPTGMNMGVYETLCGTVRRLQRARFHVASTWTVMAGRQIVT